MKRAFYLLLLIMAVLYVCEGYQMYLSVYEVKKRITGLLSDIANEVIAIPLQPANGRIVNDAANIQKDRNNLFLISDNVLYRYHKNGQFICQITRPEEISVAGYLINPVSRELIVMGNKDDIFYYTFDGELLGRKKLKSDFAEKRILSFSLHNGQIKSIEENNRIDPDTHEVVVVKEMNTYNIAFEQIDSQRISYMDNGRSRLLYSLGDSQLCVDADTGNMFVYVPSPSADYLLEDTLLVANLWRNKQRQTLSVEEDIPVVPARPLGRFWFSSYSLAGNEELNYTFCYDSKTHGYTTIKGGFSDDFCQTGIIRHIQPMDIVNRSYCFVQQGKAVEKLFPDQAISGNVVLFIVKMKEA